MCVRVCVRVCVCAYLCVCVHACVLGRECMPAGVYVITMRACASMSCPSSYGDNNDIAW